MPIFGRELYSRLRSLTDLGGIFERPKGVKSRLGVDRHRGLGWKTVNVELTEDVLGGVDRVPSELDSEDVAPQDYKLKIDMNEV